LPSCTTKLLFTRLCNSDQQPPIMAWEHKMTVDTSTDTFQKHPDFWFPDGSITLIAGNFEFRVHQGILAMQSEVFKDIFSIPQPEDAEQIDGCPIVHLSDPPADIAEVLSILYCGIRYNGTDEYPSWEVVRAMFCVGDKYQMPNLKDAAMKNLSRAFPTDIETWDKLQSGMYPCMTIQQDEYISIASLAREHHDIPSHIRWQALYHCCQLSNSALVDGVLAPDGTKEILSVEDLKLCLHGRRTLMVKDLEQTADVGYAFPSPACTTDACMRGWTTLRCFLGQFFSWSGFAPNPLNDLSKRILGDCERDSICKSCAEKHVENLTSSRQTLLSELQKYFQEI